MFEDPAVFHRLREWTAAQQSRGRGFRAVNGGWGGRGDHENVAFHRLGEYNAATAPRKDLTARECFVIECCKAVRGLVSASTVTTNLDVDVEAVAGRLADDILSSPRRYV